MKQIYNKKSNHGIIMERIYNNINNINYELRTMV